MRSKSCHLQRLLHSIMDQTPLSTGRTVLCTHRAGFANGAKTSCCLDGSLPAVAPLLSLLPPCFLNRHFHLPNDPKTPQGTFSITPAHFLHPPSWCLGDKAYFVQPQGRFLVALASPVPSGDCLSPSNHL